MSSSVTKTSIRSSLSLYLDTSTEVTSPFPYLRLPPEIRNKISILALTADGPIVNPQHNSESSIKPFHRVIPALGTALLRTCRQIYLETDSRMLYTSNAFAFTRVAHISAFFAALTTAKTRLITAVTIDLRETSAIPSLGHSTPGDPIALEWIHYLACNHLAHAPGVWCSKLTTLRKDVPQLKRLTIDIRGWKKGRCVAQAPAWMELTSLLRRVRNLESINILGSGAEFWNLTNEPRPFSLGGWYSVGRWVEEMNESLMPILCGTVRDALNDNEVRWVGWRWTSDRKLFSLEVEILSRQTMDRSELSDPDWDRTTSWEHCLTQTKDTNRYDNPIAQLLS